MAHHRLGHVREGRGWLGKAVERMNRETRNDTLPWNRRVTLQLLRLEAAALVTGPKT
jgi:hypothetical protein